MVFITVQVINNFGIYNCASRMMVACSLTIRRMTEDNITNLRLYALMVVSPWRKVFIATDILDEVIKKK